MVEARLFHLPLFLGWCFFGVRPMSPKLFSDIFQMLLPQAESNFDSILDVASTVVPKMTKLYSWDVLVFHVAHVAKTY